MNQKKITLLLSSLLFVLSGVAALIYQITWFKQLSYFIGNSTYAQAVVLATFMGGLAIGSKWFGKKADESKNPVLLFAILEIAIGIYCFFYMPIFEVIERVFISIVVDNHWKSDSSVVLLLKIIASSLAMIIPTILMGGTLPVLVKCLSAKINDVGKNVAALYFINSLGAVLGSLLAGFYLLDYFGLTFTTYIGAGLDFITGLAFLIIAIAGRETIPDLAKSDLIAENKYFTPLKITKFQYRAVLLTAGISGLCAMIYEVSWLRLLIPILSSSTYSFTLVLTAFISGITLGSLFAYFLLQKVKNQYLLLGLCQAAIVLSIFISLPFYERIPFYIWDSISLDEITELGYQKYLQVQFLYVFLVMLGPTIFMGMSLPIASNIITSHSGKSGESVGNIFAINTIGTVIGSLLAGLLLIPLIGIKNTIDFAILLNMAVAIAILFSKNGLKLIGKVSFTLIILIGLFVYFGNVQQNRWAKSIMLSEIPRKINTEQAPSTFNKFIKQIEANKDSIIYYNEGVSGTIVVAKKGEQVYLFTNGKGDANSVTDLQSQSCLGHLPVILHPSPDSIFVIGLGAGHTIGSALLHKEVKFAEVAEISPEVIEASVFFNHVNHKPLKDKRLHVIQDDGVSALRLSARHYDLIISQPSNPWSAGVGNLFTKDFFHDCKLKLRPGGIVAQWFSLYEMNDETLKLILRTAFSEFKEVSLWHLGKADVLLLCSETEINFDLDKIHQKYNNVRKELANPTIGINHFTTLLSLQKFANSDQVKQYTSRGPINTEDHPLLELWAPKSYFLDASPTKFTALNGWKNYQESELLLRKYELGTKPLSIDEKIDVSLFKAGTTNGKSKKFLKEYNLLNEVKNHVPIPKYTDSPSKLFFGWMEADNSFHALDSINPNQIIHLWSCCSSFERDVQLKYLWKHENGAELISDVTHKKDWTTSWVPFPKNKEMTEGKWQITLFLDQKTLLTDSFYVSKNAPLVKPFNTHNQIHVGILNKNNSFTPLTRIHPMQTITVYTMGIDYGIREFVNAVWTAPSGIKYNQAFSYFPNYTSAWLKKAGPAPMEVGKWTVEINSFSGENYLKAAFEVTTEVDLLAD